tara:strand:+ start:312 stop:1025 length:714 start_codon:yes stop_codon:yes gene_type:complete
MRKNISVWGINKGLLALRGIAGTSALFFFYESVQRFALSEAVAIQYLHPIFAVILASALISEKAGKIIYLSIVFGLIGIFIILEFPLPNNFNTPENINLFIALAGSVLTGLAYVLVRWLSNEGESPFVIMFYFPLFTVPISFMFTIKSWINPDARLWIYLILIGICAQIAQYFLTYGYKLLPAGKASLTGYVQVPFSVLAGYLFFGDKITYGYFIGSFMIFASVILMVKATTNPNYN